MLRVLQVSEGYVYRDGIAHYKFCIKKEDDELATIDWEPLRFRWQLGNLRQYNDIFLGGSK